MKLAQDAKFQDKFCTTFLFPPQCCLIFHREIINTRRQKGNSVAFSNKHLAENKFNCYFNQATTSDTQPGIQLTVDTRSPLFWLLCNTLIIYYRLMTIQSLMQKATIALIYTPHW